MRCTIKPTDPTVLSDLRVILVSHCASLRPVPCSASRIALGPHPSQSAVGTACRPCFHFWRSNPRAATAVLTGLAKRALWDVSTKVLRLMLEEGVETWWQHVKRNDD